MIKAAIVAITLLAYSTLCLAQSTDTKQPTRFGLQAGFIYAGMNFNAANQPNSKTENTAWGSGVHANFFITIPLSKKLLLQPAYGLLTAAYNRKDSGLTYKFAYLTMPLLLKYQVVPSLFIDGGVQLDLLLNAKKNGSSTAIITHDTEERNVGATAGLQYCFTNKIFATTRYTHGFNHIGLYQRTNAQEYKSQQWLLAFGICF